MTTPTIAIIGGTGLNSLPNFISQGHIDQTTPFGKPSSPIQYGTWNKVKLQFIARHGDGHTIPPHLINYRANISALKAAGATHVIAINAVGGISSDFAPGDICIPSDVIDYTYGREHTFCDGKLPVEHIEFTPPYDASIYKALVASTNESNSIIKIGGVHGVTQGPRLESVAEIKRMERDGCDLVGMTGMPEAALAREAGLAYACIAVSVNWAAGKNPNAEATGGIHAEIEESIAKGMNQVMQLLEIALPNIQ